MHEIFVGIRVVGDPHDPVVSRKLRIFIRSGQRLSVLVAIVRHTVVTTSEADVAPSASSTIDANDTVADPALKHALGYASM